MSTAALVTTLRRRGLLEDEALRGAFAAVDRGAFLPGVTPERVYADQAVPTAWEDGRPTSSSSQPSAMAKMLRQLEVRPGDRVLEVGTGTGYNAAVLDRLVSPGGRVITVELTDTVAAEAARRLAVAGFSRVVVVRADGAQGVPGHAPFDRIVVTAGTADLAPAWRDQLAPGGRLVVPLSLHGAQCSVAFDAASDGRLISRSVEDVSFMGLRGPVTALPPPQRADDGRTFVDGTAPVDVDRLAAGLNDPGPALATGVKLDAAATHGDLHLWLALHERSVARVIRLGEPPRPRPTLLRLAGQHVTVGIVAGDGRGALLHADSGPDAALTVIDYGDQAAAARLQDRVVEWDRRGRPDRRRLRIVATASPSAEADAWRIDGDSTSFAVRWA